MYYLNFEYNEYICKMVTIFTVGNISFIIVGIFVSLYCNVCPYSGNQFGCSTQRSSYPDGEIININ